MIKQMSESKAVIGLNMLTLWKDRGTLEPWIEPLREMLDDGTVKPVVAGDFAFEDAGAAQTMITERRNVGKVVLTPVAPAPRRQRRCAAAAAKQHLGYRLLIVSLPAESYQLKGLSPKAYEHPADRAATAALKAIPHLDTVVRKIIEFGYERALRRGILGSAVRLGDDQLGDVWRAHASAYFTLDLEPVPDLYLMQFPIANALTFGAGRPAVVINSELLQLLDEQQLRGVLAHEAGHVLSDHVLYRTALVILMRLSALPGVPVPLFPLRAALMEWFRAAELSCDRAASLVDSRPARDLPDADGDRRRRGGREPRSRRVHEAGAGLSRDGVTVRPLLAAARPTSTSLTRCQSSACTS